MKRWLLNLAVLLSLVLLIATVTAWHESHIYRMEITVSPLRLTWLRGEVIVEYGHVFLPDDEDGVALTYLEAIPDTRELIIWVFGVKEWSVLGIDFFDVATLLGSNSNASDGWAMIVPAGYFVALFTILPLLWLVFFRRSSCRYRRAHGLCVGCGYDLRGSAGACPECGTASIAKRL